MFKGIKIQKAFEIKEIFSAFSQKFGSDYFFDGEAHDFWEMVCVLEGEVGIVAGKYVYKMKKGECFFHRPMEFHRLWAESGTEPVIAIFSFSCNHMIRHGYGMFWLTDTEMKTVKKLGKDSDMIFKKELGIIVSQKENTDYELWTFINELENLVIDIFKNRNSVYGITENPTTEKFTAAIKVMEDNLDKRLSSKEISDLCNISLPNLKKIFKKYSGSGVMEYFANMKIKAAKSFLKEGRSVKETAFMLGFYDQNYFNVFFKRYTGVSPGKYRTEE